MLFLAQARHLFAHDRMIALVILACALLPAWAGDWPAYRHDARRSAVTDEMPAFPLKLAWRYTCAQPPQPAWSEQLGFFDRLDFDYAAPPVIAEGIACFGSSSDDTVRALDAATGQERWHFITGGPVRFAPQIANGRVYCASDDGYIYCLESGTGKLVWKFRAAPADESMAINHRMVSRWPVRTGVVVEDGVVYGVAGMWNTEGVFLYALKADTGEVLWCNDTQGGSPQGALLVGGNVLVAPNARAFPTRIDRTTGKVMGGAVGGPAGSGGTWLTIDKTNLYSYAIHGQGGSILNVCPYDLTTGKAGKAWGVDQVPQLSINPQLRPFETHEKGKVSTIVHNGSLYARKAYGMALAGSALLLGQDGMVVAERAQLITSAELRFGMAGDDLLVSAVVTDSKVTPASTPWKGSCLELFGAMPGKEGIGQVFLVPGLADAPAVAYRAQGGQSILAPEIRVQSTTTATGYELSALIPLSLLALDKANPDFRLEAQVTVTGPDNTIQSDTVFGSVLAYQDSTKYGQFQLKPLPTALTLDRVKAALASTKPYIIKMRGNVELWRTEIEGEAREIAVANGRLYVATQRGVLYCFEPATPGGKPAALHDPAKAMQAVMPPAVEGMAANVSAQLREAGMDRGFALVLGDASGDFSVALAKATALRIENVMTDAQAANALRERLLANTALYGSRIHVQAVERIDRLPYAQYFANAVIVAGANTGLSGKELYRVLRPCGGTLLCPGLPEDRATALMKETGAFEQEMRQASVVRGKLPGALDWDSKKEMAADERVKWPLRPLWIGGPTTFQIREFRQGAAGPALANGRSLIKGENTLTAVDAYNGEILWSRPIPQRWQDIRSVDGVLYPVSEQKPYTKTDLIRACRLNDHSVYLDLGTAYSRGKGNSIIQLDARTGEQKKFYGPYTPPTFVSLATPQRWELDMNAGSSGTVNRLGDAEVPASAGADGSHAGTVSLEATPWGLVVMLVTRDPKVTALDAWELFFDLRSPEARYGLYERGVFNIRVAVAQGSKSSPSWSWGNGSAFPAIDVSGTCGMEGTRTMVVLPWTELEKLIGTKVSSFGFAASLNMHDGGQTEPIARRHLFGDWAADGINNGWACVVIDGPGPTIDPAKPPTVIAGPANTMKDSASMARTARAVNASVIGTPGTHPLTGEPVSKVFGVAPVCGTSYYSANIISGRGSIYDLVDNSGFHPAGGVKTGCTTPQVAALGLLFISEETGHCSCNYPYGTSVALAPAERRLNEDWGQFYERDVDTAVRLASINLGAAGDRRDADGNLWLGFPRKDKLQKPEDFPNSDHPLPYPQGMRDAQTGLWHRRLIRPSVWVPLDVEVADGFGPYRVNTDRVAIRGTDRPWLYGSGYRGITKATLALNQFKPLAAVRTPAAPVVDGKLDEGIWQEIITSENPVQPLLPFTETRVLFRHDDRNLYVGLKRPPVVYSPPRPARRVNGIGFGVFTSEKRAWQMGASKPDAISPKDNWWRLIVSDRTGKQAVYLSVTADGTRADARFDEATKQFNAGWNPAWESAVLANTDGMTLEMAIPWSTLEECGIQRDALAVNFLMYDTGIGTEALTYLGLGGYDHCTNFTPLGLEKPTPAPERAFTVRLHFAEMDDVKPGQRVFDVKLQGKTVLKDFDIAKEVGVRTALVKEFTHIRSTDAMVWEFVPKGANLTLATAPIISAIEIVDEAFQAPVATQ